MQPEFINPEFINNNSADEIHERMMANLPSDIDDMPGGFPYDFTKPAALEKDEFINYHMVRALMIAFPQYAWADWLDLHGAQVHIERHAPTYASGIVTVTGNVGTVIKAGTVYCTPATDTEPSTEFVVDSDYTIGVAGTIDVSVTAVIAGIGSNVAAGTVTLMSKPDKNVSAVTNTEAITGGAERETDNDYYDRIYAEYENSMTYLGNDTDYVRWAKEAGAGDCIVIGAADGPGTVKLVLVDVNGKPANKSLQDAVYNYIVSPSDRSKRLLPTACGKLSCVAVTTVTVNYECTGLIYDESTSISQIEKDFKEAVAKVYEVAKSEDVLRYNDIRPLISTIAGVEDFTTFTINGGMINISLAKEEYPETGTLKFS